jgi:sigma-B regulation protein RsbU (phosphoserine phosphatase)
MRLSIGARLSALTLACVTLILALVVGYAYVVSRDTIVELARKNGAALAQGTASRINAQFQATAKVTETVAATLEDADLSRRFLSDLGRRILFSNPGIFGTAVAFEPQAFERGTKYFAPYSYRKNYAITSVNLGGDDYNYFTKDWYQLARELNRPVWTEPYYDDGGGDTLMITYSAPFSRRTPRGLQPAGVVTADIDLAWLQSTISSVSVSASGYVFLLSRYGAYIAHPDPALIMNETIFTHAEDLNLPSLRDLGKEMVAGRAGFAEFSDLPGVGAAYVAYQPLPDERWSLAVVLPKDELLAGANRVTRIMTGIGLAGFVLLAGVILAVSGTITRPLRILTRAAGGIAAGNLDQPMPAIAPGDEVGDLAASFASMKEALKRHIADLTTATAARERIESELRIARDIQMSILPKIFPPFPDRAELDVYASIVPAREVGGDLYDFFFADEHRFCFLIGDVSGKGVPAAFFMAVTKTLIKAVAEREKAPGRILSKVNDELAADNDSCMFVTLFLAILDTRTGRLEFGNAGHNAPLLLRRGRPPEWVGSLEEPMAGAMPDIDYTTGALDLAPGDTLFLTTDGVGEAMNPALELYTDDRLLETVTAHASAGAQDMLRAVSASVADWAGGAEQSDDITMLAVRYLGPAPQ